MSNFVPNEQGRDNIQEAVVRSQTVAAAGQFAASIMHEINNPLEAISNLNYLVLKDAENACNVREYSQQIAEQLATVVRISRRTLSFYRAADVIEPIDILALAEAALKVHREKLSAKRVVLVRDIHADTAILGHAGQILQVLSNLLSNSIDALPPNGRLTIRVRKRQGEIHITVADEGHGIPETERRSIFEPFFTTKRDQGTGLGLAISKAIVERHKGRIRVRSSVRPGKTGTTFRISLPAHDYPSANSNLLDQSASGT